MSALRLTIFFILLKQVIFCYSQDVSSGLSAKTYPSGLTFSKGNWLCLELWLEIYRYPPGQTGSRGFCA